MQESWRISCWGKLRSSSSLSCWSAGACPPTALTDGEVRAALFQMAQAISAQAQAIRAQATWEGAPRENPHSSTMASRLRDFARINLQYISGLEPIRIPQSLCTRSTRFSVLWFLMKMGRLSRCILAQGCGSGMLKDIGRLTSSRRSPNHLGHS